MESSADRVSKIGLLVAGMCERSPGAKNKYGKHQRFDLVIGEASGASPYGTWLAAVVRVAAAVLAAEAALLPRSEPGSEPARVLEVEDGVPLWRP